VLYAPSLPAFFLVLPSYLYHPQFVVFFFLHYQIASACTGILRTLVYHLTVLFSFFSVNLICLKFMEACKIINQPIRAIKPLNLAIYKIQPTREHLTAQHYMFTLSCLQAKCYRAALHVLRQNVFEVALVLFPFSKQKRRPKYTKLVAKYCC